ncbi:tetratricopeptide repeat protein [Aquirufa rosea]|uniref:Tetratricopeptide repeat protein n=1 Tax=Aquirufa rosea TaxID=2509241 RepID=A0A4Q1C2K2_9BACT|nr:tetratricopeptide repeat protein [Aquirufa rosea]RXK52416.1 tetratricopeptide repeat protein [Aquirufa rosea]
MSISSRILPFFSLFIIFGISSCDSEKDKKEATQFFFRGNQKFKEKEYYEAIKWYNEAILKKNDFSDAYYNRGLIYEQLEKNEEALNDFSEAVALDAKFGPALYKKVEMLQSMKRLDEAEQEAQKLVKLLPDSSACHRLQGDIFFEKEMNNQALASYEKAIQLDTNSVEALINKGVVLQTIGELDLAEKSFRHALTKGKYKHLIYNNLGYLEIERRQWKLAEKWVRKALEIEPNNALFLKNLEKINKELALK